MTAEEERGRRPLDRRAAPVAVLDLSRRSLWIPAGASALIAALALAGGLADDGSDDPARWVRWAEAGVVGGLPYWWTTVVYVLVAMGCWARARVEVARARYRGAGWVGPAPIGWGALSVLLVLLSADHVIGLHKAVTTDRVPWLPGPVADHPVQAVLVAVGLPVVLMVLAVATPGQRALVVLAGVLYLFSGLVLDPRLLQLPGVTYRTEALETAAEWVAAVVLLLAALQRVRMRGSARPGPPGVRTGAGLLEAVAVVDRLRSPGGDAWWAQQTSASLARYVLEEAHEVVEAVEDGDRDQVREELGDLLLQVLLQARLAAEEARAPFDVDDVAAALVSKLVRRHPHVFASGSTAAAPSVAELEAGWDALKAAEGRRTSVFDGVPVALPALQRAQAVLERGARSGLPGPSPSPLAGPGDADVLGEQLLGLVETARAGGVDAEAALRAAVRRAEQAGRAAERG